MDAFYDKHSAAEELEEMTSNRREVLGARTNSSIVHLADFHADGLLVTEMGDHYKNWCLCMPEDQNGVSDEMVARIQGIMSQNNLVPRNTHTCGARKAMFLSQQVEICGLGTPTFNEAAGKISSVVDRFEQYLAGAELGSIPDTGSNAAKIFQASNRLFTARSDAPTEQDNSFERGVDPLKVLHKLKGNELIHAPENIVRYYKRGESEGNISYEETVPGSFKTGNIVELQVSFVAIKAAMNKIKVTTRLQAVMLLSNEFSKASVRLY
ncbi:hypothetical protein B0H17DRAFT_1190594 [Mycena rosella]|uniref:Uncharacterized protein n=1 Tax=Mycena rosella TaxID=1033263 RepID=A0AAD7H3I0_MYCRO|nr:hypothetical protein B0H17DRAFT_1190594 [Mycena rosella]